MSPQIAAAATDPGLDQDAVALYRALTALTRVYQFRDRDKICCRGISVTQCYALEALVWHGPLTLNQLASHLYLDKSTVSRVVDTLERKELVRRRPHTQDRRAISLSPTRKGRQLCDRIQQDMADRERELIADFEPEVRTAMIELIGRLAREAEDHAKGLGKGCSCADGRS
ncbi:MAG: MarR family transcriptional regulator [Gemmatimonadales bacterium]|nr:MarR family transcriptional regulator [Gemmatimonadales bacterium]NIR02930.1 MarR family transcriptional regulator [Gemmatimonadales bacterium]